MGMLEGSRASTSECTMLHSSRGSTCAMTQQSRRWEKCFTSDNALKGSVHTRSVSWGFKICRHVLTRSNCHRAFLSSHWRGIAQWTQSIFIDEVDFS
eukprot:11581-Pleurochrysis_carterae.AAC.1